MIRIVICLLALCSSCKTIAGTLGGAIGAAPGAVIANPGVAMAGAGVGVLVGESTYELMNPSGPSENPHPSGTVASTVYETKDLVTTVGWWYLLIFVFVPLFTKRGRDWVGNFVSLYDSASKKEVTEQSDRLNRLEEHISSILERIDK